MSVCAIAAALGVPKHATSQPYSKFHPRKLDQLFLPHLTRFPGPTPIPVPRRNIKTPYPTEILHCSSLSGNTARADQRRCHTQRAPSRFSRRVQLRRGGPRFLCLTYLLYACANSWETRIICSSFLSDTAMSVCTVNDEQGFCRL